MTSAPVFDLVWAVLWLTRMRDRLRCPVCGAVGTYKPHGGIFDRQDSRKVRRWLCKWCGAYRGEDGIHQCVIDEDRGVWAFSWEYLGTTPQEVLRKWRPKTWPWRG